MSEKRNIDKLFKQKLGEFEATPSASVWDNVSQQINPESDDRKGIPLWWKIVGVAAGIVLLITVGTALLNSEESGSNPDQNVVDTETPVNPESRELDNDTDSQQISDPAENLDQSETRMESNNTSVADTETEPNATQQISGNQKENSGQGLEKAVVDVSTENRTESPEMNKKENKENKPPVLKDQDLNKMIDSEVAERDNPKNNDADPNAAEGSEELLKDKALIDQKKEAQETQLAESGEDQTTKEDITEDAQQSLEDAIAAQDESDSDEKEEYGNRWSVTPQVAPVYFNSLGSGSAIDDEFSGNSRTGEINMNYGIVASYDFNDKLTLRAGVNQMNLSYRTNDVIVYNNVQPDTGEKPLKNVNLNAESMDLSFMSANGLNFAQVPGVVADNIESSIDQEIGFIEIPLELEYKLSDNKVGLSIIGGMSTLILSENRIYSSLQGERTELGEASNINSTSFSANLGLGMNVKLSESIDLNLEPVFKYQLNTFKDTNGNFNPYAMGIYTGLSFKF